MKYAPGDYCIANYFSHGAYLVKVKPEQPGQRNYNLIDVYIVCNINLDSYLYRHLDDSATAIFKEELVLNLGPNLKNIKPEVIKTLYGVDLDVNSING